MTVTLDIPADVEEQLRRLSDREHLSLEETICDILRRRAAAEKFREACRVVEPRARAAGYTSEEQILESFS